MADTPADSSSGSTDFGYEQVPVGEKAERVDTVFSSVASRYDLMNDLMSAGLHRAWKRLTVTRAAIRPGMKVLDVAGGTADMSRAFAQRAGPEGQVWLTDINASMLAIGRDRMIDDGLPGPAVQCDAQYLPFPDRYFDRVCVAFGLRNMTDKSAALQQMFRVLKPGGKLLVLEFSRVTPALARAYDAYSFQVLPRVGRAVTGDADSYRYLAESIRMHPDQDTLARMMREAGFSKVGYTNMSAGIVALHEGLAI